MIRFKCPTCGTDLEAGQPYELGECDGCGASCYAPDAPLGLTRPRREQPPLRSLATPGVGLMGCFLLAVLLVGLGVGAFAAGFPGEFQSVLRWIGERMESKNASPL